MLKKDMPLGLILWKGKSLLDGERIMVIATGVFAKTENRKTGDMIQTWILRRDIDPMLARRMGEDKSICGDCKHSQESTCYVNIGQAPMNIYNAYHDERYRDFDNNDIDLFKNRSIRIGSYGDPAAIPYKIWENICFVSNNFCGYTHQWHNKKIDQRLKNYCMASIDSIVNYTKEYEKAKVLGWRTFRVFADKTGINVYDVKQNSEIVCPASKEAGVLTNCEKCNLCCGLNKANGRDVLINHHADSEAMGTMWRRNRYIAMMKKIKNKKAWRRDYAGERKIFKQVCKF